jgi:DNA-binding transcriptional LysR family regulator
MLAISEAAIDNASRFKRNELASLRIGLPPALSADLATRSLSEVVRRIPMLDVKLLSAPQSDIIVRLPDGEVDGGFLVDEGQIPDRLNTWLLRTEGFHLAVGPLHALAQREPILLRD